MAAGRHVAIIGAGAVGVISAIEALREARGEDDAEEYAYLSCMTVDEAHRRRALASLLMRAGERVAHRRREGAATSDGDAVDSPTDRTTEREGEGKEERKRKKGLRDAVKFHDYA